MQSIKQLYGYKHRHHGWPFFYWQGAGMWGRTVDPALKAGTPVHGCEPKTWGPKEIKQHVTPPGGWQNHMVEGGTLL